MVGNSSRKCISGEQEIGDDDEVQIKAPQQQLLTFSYIYTLQQRIRRWAREVGAGEPTPCLQHKPPQNLLGGQAWTAGNCVRQGLFSR